MPDPGVLRSLADIDLTDTGRLALLVREQTRRRAYEDACRRVAQYADYYRRGMHAGTEYEAQLLDQALDQYRAAADAYLGPADERGMRHA